MTCLVNFLRFVIKCHNSNSIAYNCFFKFCKKLLKYHWTSTNPWFLARCKIPVAKKLFIRNFIPTSTLARGVFKSCKEEWKSACGMLNVHSVVLCFIVKLCSFLHSTGESGQSFFASGLRRRMFFIKMTHQLLAAGLFRSWHICQQNKFLFCEINTLSVRSGKYFETTGKN